MKELIEKGIRVTVITSERSVSTEIIKKLVELGASIYVSKEFIHTKIYIIDRIEAYTSSANLTKPALKGLNVEHLCRCSTDTALQMVEELKSRCNEVNALDIALKELTRPISLRVESRNGKVGILEVSESPVKMIVSLDPLGIAFVKGNKTLLIKRGVYAETLRDLIERGFDIVKISVTTSDKETLVQEYLSDGLRSLQNLMILCKDYALTRSKFDKEIDDPVKRIVLYHWRISGIGTEHAEEIIDFFRWTIYI